MKGKFKRLQTDPLEFQGRENRNATMSKLYDRRHSTADHFFKDDDGGLHAIHGDIAKTTSDAIKNAFVTEGK